MKLVLINPKPEDMQELNEACGQYIEDVSWQGSNVVLLIEYGKGQLVANFLEAKQIKYKIVK